MAFSAQVNVMTVILSNDIDGIRELQKVALSGGLSNFNRSLGAVFGGGNNSVVKELALAVGTWERFYARQDISKTLKDPEHLFAYLGHTCKQTFLQYVRIVSIYIHVTFPNFRA